MNKHKFMPCFNCYKYYYDTGVKVCFASFPCKHLAEQYIEFYDSLYTLDNPDVAYYVKEESFAKFTNS